MSALSTLVVPRAPGLAGTVRVPGDKSVTHRAILLGALARGTTEIHHPGTGEDNLATLRAVQALGVEARLDDAEHMTIRGVGLRGLQAPSEPIDCANSGTTTRLLAGLLAGAGISATLVGDASLSRRPMRRVADPLNDLGYRVTVSDAGTLPLRIDGDVAPAPDAPPVRAVLRTASAQVKSCILLSGLFRATPCLATTRSGSSARSACAASRRPTTSTRSAIRPARLPRELASRRARGSTGASSRSRAISRRRRSCSWPGRSPAKG